MSRTSKNPTPAPQPVKTGSLTWKDRLTAEDYEELKNTFEVFDEDHSGSIDPTEINKALEELGLDKRNPFIIGLIVGLRDKNKPITFPEFLELVGSKVGETRTRDGLRKVFALFDKDENGTVDF